NGDGVTTLYQSLKDLAVAEGDTVEQGQNLGKAGMSEYNKEAGTHLHFEIRKDGKPYNPVTYFQQAKTELPTKDEQKENEDNNDMNDQENEPDKNKDQGTSGEENDDNDENA